MTDQSNNKIATEYLKRVNAALALRDVSDYREALTQLEQAIKLSPADVSAYLLLGLTYQDLEQLEAAEKNFRVALNLDPTSVEVQQALGLLLVQREQFKEAIEILEPLIKDAHNLPVQQAMASALADIGEKDKAVGVLQVAYEHFPNEAAVAAQLGRLLLETNKLKEAISILEHALELHSDPDVIANLAAGYAMQKDYKQALEILEKASENYPEYDRIWRGIAYSQLNLRNFQQALAAIDKALELNNQNFRNLQTKSDILTALGDIEQAFKVLQHSIELARQFSIKERELNNLLLDRNLKLWRTKGVQEALSQIEQDLEKFPEAKVILLSLKKEILFNEGQYEQALIAVKEAETQGVRPELITWDYLRIYDKLGRRADGEKILHSFLANTENREERLSITEQGAIQFYQIDETEIAKILLRQVLAFASHRARSLNNLGFILAGEKQWAEAEDLFKQALENQIETPAVTLANLGYIYLHQQKYTQAVQTLEDAAQQQVMDYESVLRIVCLYNNQLLDIPDEPFPKRFTSTLLAIRANLATAYHLTNQPDQAVAMAQSAIETDPKDNIGYRVLGCLYLANNEIEAARKTWEKALKLRKSKAEARLIQSWLADLPSLQN